MNKRKRGSVNSEPYVRDFRKTAENLGLDLDALHAYLWSKTDRSGRLLLTQTKVGELFDLYPMACSRVFKALELESRIQRDGNKVFVANPDVWRWDGNSRSSAP